MDDSTRHEHAHPLAAGPCADGEDCAAQRAGLPKRSSFGLTMHEEVALETVRLLLSTYLTGDARYWDGAIGFAEMNLGEADGMRIVLHATRFVRALQIDREKPFNFLTFGCQHISDDELAMMSALQAARLGPVQELEDALQHLAQDPTYPRLQKSVVELSGAIAGGASAVSQSACKRGSASPLTLH